MRKTIHIPGKQPITNQCHQKHLLPNNNHGIIVEREFTDLLLSHINNYDKARLVAASAKHSADWLNVSPIT